MLTEGSAILRRQEKKQRRLFFLLNVADFSLSFSVSRFYIYLTDTFLLGLLNHFRRNRMFQSL